MSVRFLSTSLTLPASCRQALCFDSAFLVPILPDASSTRQPFCAKLHGLLDSCASGARPHPAAGRMPPRAARFRVPRSQRLRRRRLAPPTRPGRPCAPLAVSLSYSQLLTLGCGAGIARAASAAPVLAIPPPIPTQAYGTHCPPMAALQPAPSALAAPPHQCPARFRALCLVCTPSPNPGPTILLSALSALPAPAKPTS